MRILAARTLCCYMSAKATAAMAVAFFADAMV